jgi:photosystem II stability/assembly factor-like uncharacterized protein
MQLHITRAALIAAVVLAFGLLVPAGAVAMSTGNGGWQWQNPLPHGASYDGAFFLSADHGWLVTDDCILHTQDGGASFTTQVNGNVLLKDITFVDSHGPMVIVPRVSDPSSAMLATAQRYGSLALEGGHS